MDIKYTIDEVKSMISNKLLTDILGVKTYGIHSIHNNVLTIRYDAIGEVRERKECLTDLAFKAKDLSFFKGLRILNFRFNKDICIAFVYDANVDGLDKMLFQESGKTDIETIFKICEKL